MSEPLFNEDEIDAFGEIVNIAMGQAGKILAEAFSGFVHLHVPRVHTVKSEDIQRIQDDLVEKYATLSAVRQEFLGEMSGFIMVVYGSASYAALREILGFDDREGDEIGRRQREELLLEMSNALASTCTMEIARQLELQCGLKPPRIVAIERPSRETATKLFSRESDWGQDRALQIDILFHLDAHDLPFELLITIAPQSLHGIRKSLARFIPG